MNLAMKSVIFLVFATQMISCRNQDEESEKKSTEVLKSNIDNFDPTNYKGYSYIFFDSTFVDHKYIIRFYPSLLKKEDPFRKSDFYKSIGQLPCIQIPIDPVYYHELTKQNEGKTPKGICTNFEGSRWARVYFHYINFKEYFFYEQSGERPYKKIKQSPICHVKWLSTTDSSRILSFKIIK